MATAKEQCGCSPTRRCAEANALWEAANAIYRSRGYDAWEKALGAYYEHLDRLRRVEVKR